MTIPQREVWLGECNVYVWVPFSVIWTSRQYLFLFPMVITLSMSSALFTTKAERSWTVLYEFRLTKYLHGNVP